MVHYFADLSLEISRIYLELDERIARFQSASGMRCATGCGACCQNKQVEATVLEALPLAAEICRRQEMENVLTAIAQREDQEDTTCVMYRPDNHIKGPMIFGHGACTCYDFRPLICRLFGFAARRNKRGDLELCACKIISRESPLAVETARTVLAQGLDLPVYQDSFMRIGASHPAIGYRRFSINQAVRGAIGYLVPWDAEGIDRPAPGKPGVEA